MVRQAVLVSCLLCACGASGSEIVPDGPDTCSFGDQGTLVSSTASAALQGTTTTLSLSAATQNGSMLVVGVAWVGAGGPAAFSITTEAGERATPIIWSQSAACLAGFVTWSLPNVAPGTAAIDIEANTSATFQVSVLELSGLHGNAVCRAAGTYHNTTATAAAPKLSADPGQVVISTLSSCGDAPSLTTTDGFVTVGVEGGNSLAFEVAQHSGPTGAEWNLNGAEWDANTVVLY